MTTTAMSDCTTLYYRPLLRWLELNFLWFRFCTCKAESARFRVPGVYDLCKTDTHKRYYYFIY
jgi:hypothetical protein